MRRVRVLTLPRFRQSGFTLVELLVVIAIIALLLSILTPSLSHVKELAKRVICSTNQRGLGMAMMMYANESDAILPPFHRFPSDNGSHPPYSVAFNQAPFGILTEGGYLDSTEEGESQMLYCPSQMNPNYMPNNGIRAGYMTRYFPYDWTNWHWRNPLWKDVTGDGGERWLVMQLSRLRPGMALLLDVVLWHSAANYNLLDIVPMHKQDGLNVSYGDGSVRWVSFPQGVPNQVYGGLCMEFLQDLDDSDFSDD